LVAACLLQPDTGMRTEQKTRMRRMWMAAVLAGCGDTAETGAAQGELRPASEEMRAFGIETQRIRHFGTRVEVDLLDAEQRIGSVTIEEHDGVSTRMSLAGRHISLLRGSERILEIDGEPATRVNADDQALIDLMLEISVGALSIDGPEEAAYGWCHGISTQPSYSSAFWNAYWDSVTSCGVHFYSNYIRWSDAQNPQTGAWTVAVSAHYYY
jgi:hypothetical protein